MINPLKSIRWQQRFENLNNAYNQLQKGLAIAAPSDIERQGIIQSFEFTFELCWKTLKDYLEAQGVVCRFPREVIKQAFHYQIIIDGECWLDMLAKRNLLSHTYDESRAAEAYQLIKEEFSPQLARLIVFFQHEIQDGEH
jgi:nucleotidyltransferase substrate binding protein (TIGR01987 family)